MVVNSYQLGLAQGSAPPRTMMQFLWRAALAKQECQWWPVDRGGGRGRGGPATGAGEVGVARGFPAGLAGSVFIDADAGEARGRAISEYPSDDHRRLSS